MSTGCVSEQDARIVEAATPFRLLSEVVIYNILSEESTVHDTPKVSGIT